ncbi:class I SAM-dependent methyltransferase [Marininema halotolerans]|uniref:Ubiquinone/menaquinone biosynthesis C-methylase UbiE n=1 Tax=Marininema halotolerans TaxID=1155944 RepID=A0A1I6U6K6_9BACL|nr:class I SAM-dependent methyltransferase [Marininema halotolerans]SFS97062.1 Ubiquinone/menaquinone biosynthesis C-methylase UbiE [Marininema halotolerans]
MPINFYSEENRTSYVTRAADSQWCHWFKQHWDPMGKVVVDLGCGGGIYSRAFLQMGARQVIGIDDSPIMLKAAHSTTLSDRVDWMCCDAAHTHLPDQRADLLFIRAVIHHLRELAPLLTEGLRILKPGASIIIQDRTPEDCFLPPSTSHLRGFIMASQPELQSIEAKRRYQQNTVTESLKDVGFDSIQSETLWETRCTYATLDDLAQNILQRTGRSILHDLTNHQLASLSQQIQRELIRQGYVTNIVDQDRWTIWSGIKPSLN